MGKNTLRSKVEGNELDLSFSELKEAPVKELAAIPKATRVDLSQNQLTTLPPSFSLLTHLVKLDLGQNQIEELPANFGNLENLQHLDLYSNKITVLPETFYKLDRLKFLDLKNNPLDARLAAVAGDCLDEKQCQQCAKQVVKFMGEIHDELEKQREKKSKLDKDKEVKKLAAAEKAKEKQRLAKKAAKEKRREEMRLKNLVEREANIQDENIRGGDSMHTNDTQVKENSQVKPTSRCSVWKWILALITIATGVISIICYVEQPEETLRIVEECKSIVTKTVLKYSSVIRSNAVIYFDLCYKFAHEKVEDTILWLKENKYF